MSETIVSVIMAVARGRARAERAIAHLLAQEGIDRAEVLVIDAGPPGAAGLAGCDHPSVRVIRVEQERTYGELRALGVRAAQGEIVAFLEDHAFVSPGWLQAVEQAFEGPWDAVGGIVRNANPGVGVSQAITWVDYGPWLGDGSGGEAQMIPGNNSAYGRRRLLRYGEDLDRLLMTDVLLQWRILADGGRLYLAPSLSVDHLAVTAFGPAMRLQHHYHRCLAALRAEEYGWSWLRRMAYALAAPAVLGRRMARTWGQARRWDGFTWRWWLKELPIILSLQVACVLGLGAGALLGPGRALERFTACELDEPRPFPDAR